MALLFRALAGLILGLVIFAGLIYFLVLVNFTQRLVTPEVYEEAISQTNAYNRIYDEALVDEALRDYTENFLGNLDLGTNEEYAEEAAVLLREVFLPAYIREQTEENIKRFTDFLRYEREDLQIYATLNEPLGRIEPVVLGRMRQAIDDLEAVEGPTLGCSPADFQSHAAAYSNLMAQWSRGRLPTDAPSLQQLDTECRRTMFDMWFELMLNEPTTNAHTALILEGARDEIRVPFLEGDTKALQETVAPILLQPLIDDAVADIRRELWRDERFDVLQWVADDSDDFSKEDIEGQAEALRGMVGTANGSGRIIALLMVVIGSLLMSLAHFPRLADMLRWPGITLLIGGGVCLAVGAVVNSAIPSRIGDAVANVVSYSDDTPAAAINLAADLLESFARQVTAGFIPAAVTVMVAGAVLVVASLFAGTLTTIARPLLPGGRSKG